jgi:DNA polymerase I-like protein with 3'-5' exonuclease and polymerase domains
MAMQLSIFDATDKHGKVLQSQNKFVEATSRANLPTYIPGAIYKFKKVLYNAYPGLPKSSYDKEMELYNKTFLDTHELIGDTAILFPFFTPESFKADGEGKKKKKKSKYDKVTMTDEEIEMREGLASNDATRKHQSFFTNIVNLIFTKENKFPRIFYYNDPKFCGDELKVAAVREVTTSAITLLDEHVEIRKLLFNNVQLAKAIFPNVKFPSSLSKCYFETFKTWVHGREILIGFIPPVAIMMIEGEKVFQFTSDCVSTLGFDRKYIRPKLHIIKTEAKLRETLTKLKESGCKSLAVDTETTGLNPVFKDQRIISGSFSDGKESWAFLVQHPRYPKHSNLHFFDIIDSYDFRLIFQNGKYDLKWLYYFKGHMPKSKLLDTNLIDHWLNEGYGSLAKKLSTPIFAMDRQIVRYLGYRSHKTMLDKYFAKIPERVIPETKKAADMTYKEVVDLIDNYVKVDHLEPSRSGGIYAELPLLVLLKYGALDVWMTHNICTTQLKMVVDEMEAMGKGRGLPKVITETHEIQMRALALMEITGAPINYDLALEQIKKASRIANDTQEELRTLLDKELVPQAMYWTKVKTGQRFVKEDPSFDVKGYETYNNVNLSEELPKDINLETVNFDSDAELLKLFYYAYKLKPMDFYDPRTKKVVLDEAHLKMKKNVITWVDKLIKYRKACKARNTYLINFITSSYKGRMYFNMNITGTVTGRLSSDNPNIQNIPKTLLEGKGPTPSPDTILIKQVIGVSDDRVLVDMDLAAAEVKVLTVYARDSKLIDAIKKDLDLHCYSAHLMYGVPYEDLFKSKELDVQIEKGLASEDLLTDQDKIHLKYRKQAKAVTFGTIYGIGPDGLSRQLPFPAEVPDAERKLVAQDLLDKLLNLYPMIDLKFKKVVKDLYKSDAASTVYFGRVRRFTHTLARSVARLLNAYEADKSDKVMVLFFKSMVSNNRPFRQFLNFQVQSATSDYMQYIMARVIQGVQRLCLLPEFYFNVHDSFVLSILKSGDYEPIVREIIREAVMDYANSIHDSLPVQIGYGLGFSQKYCG